MKLHKRETALKAAGAVLVRQKKHKVYRLPNGQSLTVAVSLSDHRGEQNALGDLRKALARQVVK